jgi:hypothetical protein
MFEGAQQQVGDKGAHDLHRQGILTVAAGQSHLLDIKNNQLEHIIRANAMNYPAASCGVSKSK